MKPGAPRPSSVLLVRWGRDLRSKWPPPPLAICRLGLPFMMTNAGHGGVVRDPGMCRRSLHGNQEVSRLTAWQLPSVRIGKGRDEASLDAVAKALARFEEHAGFRDFRKFHVEQARAFKAHLAKCTNERTGKPLAASTVYSTLSV